MSDETPIYRLEDDSHLKTTVTKAFIFDANVCANGYANVYNNKTRRYVPRQGRYREDDLRGPPRRCTRRSRRTCC